MLFGLILALGIGLISCTSQPVAVTAPDVDPQHAAEQAIANYDSNNDQALAADELANVASLQAAADGGADKNNDGKLSLEEIADRIRSWTSGGISMVYVPLRVSYRGQPLGGAKVELIPEDFLGSSFKPAVGVTDGDGMALMHVADDDLPVQNRGLGAMYAGFYRVKVTHPSIKLPSRFNSETSVGIEVAGDYRMTGLPLQLK